MRKPARTPATIIDFSINWEWQGTWRRQAGSVFRKPEGCLQVVFILVELRVYLGEGLRRPGGIGALIPALLLPLSLALGLLRRRRNLPVLAEKPGVSAAGHGVDRHRILIGDGKLRVARKPQRQHQAGIVVHGAGEDVVLEAALVRHELAGVLASLDGATDGHSTLPDLRGKPGVSLVGAKDVVSARHPWDFGENCRGNCHDGRLHFHMPLPLRLWQGCSENSL